MTVVIYTREMNGSHKMIWYDGFYPRPSYIVQRKLPFLPYNFLFFGSHALKWEFFSPYFQKVKTKSRPKLLLQAALMFLSEFCHTERDLFSVDIPLFGIISVFTVFYLLCKYILAYLIGVLFN